MHGTILFVHNILLGIYFVRSVMGVMSAIYLVVQLHDCCKEVNDNIIINIFLAKHFVYNTHACVDFEVLTIFNKS